MKKLIAALIATACAGAMAQFAVYDYSASINRLNPEIKKTTYKSVDAFQKDSVKKTVYAERFVQKSDKITGYVQLPLCGLCTDGPLAGSLYEGEPEVNDFWHHAGFFPADQEVEHQYRWNEAYEGLDNDCKFRNEWNEENDRDGERDFQDWGLYGKAYLTRKNDSYMQKKAAYRVYKVVVRAEIGIFGSYIDLQNNIDNYNRDRNASNTEYKDTVQQNPDPVYPWVEKTDCAYLSWPIDNGKASSKAWMSLSYVIPGYNELLDIGELVSALRNSGEKYQFGFLGWGHAEGSTVYETGFGTIYTSSSSEVIGLCKDTKTEGCRMVKQMSGTLVGWPKIVAACGEKAIWDLCDFAASTNKTVISGTWTLKFNKKITDDGSEAKQEKAILDKLTTKENNAYVKVLNTTGDGVNISVDDAYMQPANIPNGVGGYNDYSGNNY